jgi:hypothetical protein
MSYTFTIGSVVRCTDGRAGEISGLIINPNRGHIDYVILDPGTRGGPEIFVPSGQVQRASAQGLNLPYTWADLEQLPHPARHTVQGTVQDNLPDLLTARAGVHVRGTDGSPIGRFHGAVANADLNIEAIVLEQAPDRAVPITQLARHGDDHGTIVVDLAREAAA